MENTQDDNPIVNAINEECQELKNIKYKTKLS